ncbi:TrmH family RNA methyltransferase [Christensenella timonensis]|uniref:TrmH family RNA methyltransferase n=1 Tax=Christensenella timonensis TaxID=1816678 RepID=UPI0008351377|nr:RNA methyltransferase [Christensenella timonensis]
MKEIKSHSNEYIKTLRSLKKKRARDEEGKYIIEGMKTIGEALGAAQEVECILTAEPGGPAAALAKEYGVQVISVPYEIIQQVADTKTPPNDIACVKKQENLPDYGGSFYVALDDVNDPKNLGTIIRTADAAGAEGVFISDTSADFYGPKAQRAAMGSTFHVPIEVCSLPHTLKKLKSTGVQVVAGSLAGQYGIAIPSRKACVVIGNEARGISKDVQELADVLYKIRIYGRAESLNASVAAGIMLYDVRKVLGEQG